MVSRKSKKPVLYWVTLAVMLVAFVGVAMSADIEMPDRVDADRGMAMDINVTELLVSNASEAAFCSWEAVPLDGGES